MLSAQTPHTIQSSALELTFTDAELKQITALMHRDDPTNWLLAPGALYQVEGSDDLQPTLTAEALPSGEIRLTLRLFNPTTQSIRADVTFPQLLHIGADDPATLAYCFPRQAAVIGDAKVSVSESYSARFPLQFVDVHRPAGGGVYLMTCDLDMHRKRYFLNKQDSVSMGARYLDQVVAPGETLVLPPAIVGAHEGDWHEALAAYRRWVATWPPPLAPRKSWFARVFNFRQLFLHPNMEMSGLYSPTDRALHLHAAAEQDARAFGAVDYVHLFDWSQTPDQGRVGDYAPWDFLPPDSFSRELRKIQSADRPVGLYFEGYLISPVSRVGRAHGSDWQMRSAAQKLYDPFGSGDFYACPTVAAWREHLTQAVRRAAAATDADGYYIDQIGFGYQYPCYNAAHDHPIPSNQPRAEAELMRGLREALPAEKVLYTEQTPVDVATRFQDGSFSYTLLHARGAKHTVPIDLARFALPTFKMIQILHGDAPIGDDQRGVMLVFFNGEGLWLAGPSNNARWFSPAVLRLIARTHAILRRHADAFTSTDVKPLVPTLEAGLHANRFVGDDRVVWTLYNASDQPIRGPVLRVAHIPGARYRDAWNDQPLVPGIENGQATLSLNLEAGDVGCIVQQR